MNQRADSLAQQAYDQQHRRPTSLEEVLRAEPDLLALARRRGWFAETIERIDGPTPLEARESA